MDIEPEGQKRGQQQQQRRFHEYSVRWVGGGEMNLFGGGVVGKVFFSRTDGIRTKPREDAE